MTIPLAAMLDERDEVTGNVGLVQPAGSEKSVAGAERVMRVAGPEVHDPKKCSTCEGSLGLLLDPSPVPINGRKTRSAACPRGPTENSVVMSDGKRPL